MKILAISEMREEMIVTEDHHEMTEVDGGTEGHQETTDPLLPETTDHLLPETPGVTEKPQETVDLTIETFGWTKKSMVA